MNVIIEDPILTKNQDYSITCSFKIQYVTLPIAVPNPSVSAYSLRCYLKCEGGTFGHLVFESNSDPPPADAISGTVLLVPPSPDEVKPSEHYSVEGKPPYAYADVKFVGPGVQGWHNATWRSIFLRNGCGAVVNIIV